MKQPHQSTPPKWALRLLNWFCREEIAEEIEGDLTEVFHQRTEEGLGLKAHWLFALGVLTYIKPRNLKIFSLMPPLMLYKSYLKMTFRDLLKKGSYGLLNIFGLSLGLVAALYMGLYVLNELSYDRHIQDCNSIYRVVTHMKMGDDPMGAAITPKSLGYVMQNEIPEIESFGSFFAFPGISFELEGQKYQEAEAYLVSNTILDIFDFPMLLGSDSAFHQGEALLLSRSCALNYFGTLDVIGKTIKTDQNGLLTIKGVYEDAPHNSHFKPKMLANPMGAAFTDMEHWGDFNAYTYVKVKGGSAEVEAKLPALIDKYMANAWKKNFDGVGKLSLQKLTDIHLHPVLDYELGTSGDVKYVHGMAALGIFVLIVVAINYINMTSARATTRLKEIGIRKVLGSVKSTIRVQFIIESLLITTISATFALILYLGFLPYFNSLTGLSLSISTLLEPTLFLSFCGVVVLVGVIGAWYPAGFVSRFRSADIFRKNLKIGGSSLPMSKFLNAVQFGVALVMITITLIVYQQIQYLKTYDLGYDKDRIVKLDMKERLNPDMGRRLKNQLLTESNIEDVTIVKQAPGEDIAIDGLHFEMPAGGFKVFKSNFNTADESFLSTLGISLLAGRNFDLNSDKMARAVLVNEQLVKMLGYTSPQEILGQRIALPLGDEFYAEVIGVMENFHLESLRHTIKPLIVVNFPNISTTLLVKINPKQIAGSLETIDKITREISRSSSFSATMLDQAFWSQYHAEEVRSTLLLIFSALTVAMAFLGLFGLVSYSVERKVKEMTLRRIFGAGMAHIMMIYFQMFGLVFLIASIIGVPIAHWAGSSWLEGFAYRINMPFQPFILAGSFLVVGMTMIIVIKSWCGHTMNPVETLRDE